MAASARDRDPVTDRHDEFPFQLTGLEVHTDGNHNSDDSTVNAGTVEAAAGDDGAAVLTALNSAETVQKTFDVRIGNRTESVENLLVPWLYPDGTGFWVNRLHRAHNPHRMSPHEHLITRTQCAFSPFTVQAPYLLFLRAIDLATQCITDQRDCHVVNKRAFEQTQDKLTDQLGKPPTTEQVLDRMFA